MTITNIRKLQGNFEVKARFFAFPRRNVKEKYA